MENISALLFNRHLEIRDKTIFPDRKFLNIHFRGKSSQ